MDEKGGFKCFSDWNNMEWTILESPTLVERVSEVMSKHLRTSSISGHHVIPASWLSQSTGHFPAVCLKKPA